jgi:hypothetical protein
MSEALTPEEESIETDLGETPEEDVPVEDEYDGPDPEDDPKGDGSDEDQGTATGRSRSARRLAFLTRTSAS